MDSMHALPASLIPGQAPSALAPMQDVTTLPFMSIVGNYGAPDLFFTEYFRVHEHSRLEPHILASITENDTGRPVFAQMIGEDIAHLRRTTRELLRHPVAGIDLNMGCPAPKVYRKNVGGGLLRDVQKVDAILGALREECAGQRFTVKMRIGFDSDENFDAILELIAKHGVDALSLHARTVKEMYRSVVHYEYIAKAVAAAPCPVLANGEILNVARAADVLATTGAHGVMVGRHAIRNPWIFRQWREHQQGLPIFAPTLGDVRGYAEALWEQTRKTSREDADGRRHVAYMKKFLNFVALSVDAEGAFLHAMRRTREPAELFAVCDAFLATPERSPLPFADLPYPNLVARPTREKLGASASGENDSPTEDACDGNACDSDACDSDKPLTCAD